MSRLRLPESRVARAGLAVLALLLGVNLLAALVDAIAPSPSGPRVVVVRHQAGRARGVGGAGGAQRRPHPRAAPPSFRRVTEGRRHGRGDGRRADHRRRGARAAALRRAGRSRDRRRRARRWTRTLLDGEPPEWEDDGPKSAKPSATAEETAGVERVETAGDGRWDEEGVLAGDDGAR